MLKSIRETILVPLFQRLGTMLATALIGLGVHADLAAQVGIGAVAALLIIVDLVGNHLSARVTKLKAQEEVLSQFVGPNP